MKPEEAVIQFLGYYVENFEFKTNDQKIKSEGSVQVNFDFKKEAFYTEDKLELTIISDIFKDNEEAPFTFSFKIKGIFKFKISNEEEKQQLESNAIAIFFPYLRSFVTNFTVNAGFKPLIIPTFNFNKILDN